MEQYQFTDPHTGVVYQVDPVSEAEAAASPIGNTIPHILCITSGDRPAILSLSHPISAQNGRTADGFYCYGLPPVKHRTVTATTRILPSLISAWGCTQMCAGRATALVF